MEGLIARSAIRSIAAALALILAAPPGHASAEIGSGFDVTRYAISLTPNLVTKAVTGAETIELRATQAGLSELAFSPNALTITRATLDNIPINVTSDAEGLVFHLAAPLPIGRPATLRFALSGIPKRGIEATPTGLYTSYFACDWMVCLQDSPGDKALLALDLHVPEGIDTLAIGHEKATRRADGEVIHQWRTDRPWSPYLFGFAAGRFPEHVEQHGGATLTYLDATGEGADLDARFAATGAILDFLSGRAGLGLPARRYAQVLTPGWEAQEAATFSLIGVAHLDRERTHPTEDWVIVHELAHQWWGNLVTCASWRDFWLNEGMATFMTAAWKEARDGRAGYEAELDVARARVAKVRALGYDKPLAWSGDYPSLGVRRAVQYSKGALFLDHLRTMIGDAAFWSGIRAFTRAHAGGTVTSADFEATMEKASGRDLSATFTKWVYGDE